MVRVALEAVAVRRGHWFQFAGIAIALICTFFAIRNYFSSRRISDQGERDVSFVSRLLARWID
jgi:copper oxidase (laccase) domain-containing protein